MADHTGTGRTGLPICTPLVHCTGRTGYGSSLLARPLPLLSLSLGLDVTCRTPTLLHGPLCAFITLADEGAELEVLGRPSAELALLLLYVHDARTAISALNDIAHRHAANRTKKTVYGRERLPWT